MRGLLRKDRQESAPHPMSLRFWKRWMVWKIYKIADQPGASVCVSAEMEVLTGFSIKIIELLPMQCYSKGLTTLSNW